MIGRRIGDRDRVTQQRLHTIDEYFHPFQLALPTGRDSKTDDETREFSPRQNIV
jgi:hypothetical protein